VITYELGLSQSAELAYELGSQSAIDAGATGFYIDSSLKLWLDASDTSTISHSTGNVTSWGDKSGNANNATTSSGSPRTGDSTQNGKNVIDFTTSQMTLPSALYTIPSGANTLFVVAKRTTETGLIGTTIAMATGATNQYFHIFGVAGFQSFTNRDAGGGSRSVSGITNTNFSVAYMRRSSTTQGIAVNSTTLSTNTSATDATPTAAYIGTAASLTLPLIGSIAEIILYNAAITDAQALTVMNYLSRKWNVTLT
jgi:hypothetical protein|tara:strand:- start:2996 stop:3757 length:762 start_codon:yes stop_codon:yes gene_type:complete